MSEDVDRRTADMHTSVYGDLLTRATDLLPKMTEIRRLLHSQPEAGLHLPKTQALVADELRAIGLGVKLGRAATSVTARVVGAKRGRTVVLRADMDALEIEEKADVPYASTIPGRMHACGHDLHTAMLIGAAHLLTERAAELHGDVLLLFQPGEEGHFGARTMLEEGVAAEFGEDPIGFALHVFSHYPAGELHIRPGPIMAASDTIRLVVRGRGGHASAPQASLDPITVSAQIVMALHAARVTKFGPFEPVVVSITGLHAGTAPSAIPSHAELFGTIRTVSAESRERAHRLIQDVVRGISESYGAQADLRIDQGYPVTINDPIACEDIMSVASDILGADAVHLLKDPIMAAEDFSHFLDHMPGAIGLLGARPPNRPASAHAPSNHSSRVEFEESVMAAGAAIYAGVAMAKLTPAPRTHDDR